ncbi:MAG: hypothetical protein WAO91_08695 [Candidatus Nitrosotenuis sp.]
MKIPTKSRRGIFDAGIIILGIIIVIVAIISATLAWSDVLQVAYVSLITKIPKFDYQVHGGSESGNKNFEIYATLRTISFFLIVFVLMFAGLSVMFERINIMPAETAFKIISKSIYFVFFFFFFPPLWDISSTAVEQLSVWILNPQDIENPSRNIEILLKKLGSIECVDPNDPKGNCHFTLDKLVAGMTDPFGALKNIFQTSFLGVFKAIAFLSFMFMSFLMGTIRQVLTAIVIVGLPVLLILSLLPFFKRVVDRFIDAMLGLLIAPIFSSLVIVAGVAYLGTINGPDPIMEWFAALAIMILASLVPAMTVPMIGPLVGMAHGMAGAALSTGGMIASISGLGVSRGIASITGTIQGRRVDGISDPKSSILGSGVTSIVQNAQEMTGLAKSADKEFKTPPGAGEGFGKVPQAIIDSVVERDMSRASLSSASDPADQEPGRVADVGDVFSPPRAIYDSLGMSPPYNESNDISSKTVKREGRHGSSFGDFVNKFTRTKRSSK